MYFTGLVGTVCGGDAEKGGKGNRQMDVAALDVWPPFRIGRGSRDTNEDTSLNASSVIKITITEQV